MATKSKKNTKKRKITPLFTIAVVILALIILFLMIFVKKDQIISNFKEVNFFDRVFGKTPEFVEKHETLPKKDSNEEKAETITLNLISEKNKESKIETKEEVPVKSTENEKTEQIVLPEKNVETPKKEVEKVPEPVKKVEDKKVSASPALMDLQICYVYIDSTGSVIRKIIKKSVAKSDSPLTSSINTLLKGPDKTKADEKNCMTLIPEGTKLLSAKVKDGVAYLSFSEEFQINDYGADGYQNQLMQVVYTATAFSTVNSVQFLIEGEKIPYLSEGIWIGSPLSRGSF